MRRQCFVRGALPSPHGKCTTNWTVCAISSLQFMNRAFSPAPKSPSCCRLCDKASATLFPFSLCIQTGQAVRQTQNSPKWCESLLWCCCLPLLMAGLASRFSWPTLRVPCRLCGRGCLQAAQFLPHSEGWHWIAKYSRTKVRDYGNAGLRVRGILLVCFSEFLFCLPLCKISKAAWLNTWVFLFVFSLCWFSFPRAIFSFNK